MTITTTQATNIIDNISKTLVDLESALISTSATTITNINNGQIGAANTLQARFNALSAADKAGAMSSAWLSVAEGVQNFATVTTAEIYAVVAPMLIALDTDIGGLREFLLLNSLQVHSEFAAAWNWISANPSKVGMQVPLSPISPTLVFPAGDIILGSVAVTGAAAGTFSAGTDETNLIAPQQLYLKNIGVGATTGTATVFGVTYTDETGSHTTTQALSGALASGAKLAIGSVSGFAVTNITVNSSGAASDDIAVVVQALRSVAY